VVPGLRQENATDRKLAGSIGEARGNFTPASPLSRLELKLQET